MPKAIINTNKLENLTKVEKRLTSDHNFNYAVGATDNILYRFSNIETGIGYRLSKLNIMRKDNNLLVVYLKNGVYVDLSERNNYRAYKLFIIRLVNRYVTLDTEVKKEINDYLDVEADLTITELYNKLFEALKYNNTTLVKLFNNDKYYLFDTVGCSSEYISGYYISELFSEYPSEKEDKMIDSGIIEDYLLHDFVNIQFYNAETNKWKHVTTVDDSINESAYEWLEDNMNAYELIK